MNRLSAKRTLPGTGTDRDAPPPAEGRSTQIFSGLVKCADCGWSLAFSTNRQNKKPYSYYHCSKNDRACTSAPCTISAMMFCTPKSWRESNTGPDKLLSTRSIWYSGFSDPATRSGQQASKSKTTKLNKAEKRKTELDHLFAKMYEDWAAGRITEYNFNMLSQKYQAEQQELARKIETLQAALAAQQQSAADAEKWYTSSSNTPTPQKLTAELLTP